MAKSDLKSQLQENGWVLIKNVFSEQEIEDIRAKVYDTKKSGYKGDLFSNPRMSSLIYDDRIVKVLKELLGDDVVYFGDSGYLVDNKAYGFHKDSPDRTDANAPDFQGDYTVIRVGIYLQDHTNSSGGVLLRDKSHKELSIMAGRAFNVPIEKGDIAIWYLMTTHSGNARIFKVFKNLIINPKYYKFVPNFLFIPEKAERIGVFMTYGIEDKHLARYLTYLKTRQYAVTNWHNSVFDQAAMSEAAKHGLKILDIRPEVINLKVEDLNEFHKDIPY